MRNSLSPLAARPSPQSTKHDLSARLPHLFILIHVFLPIFIGASMYSLWRSGKLMVFDWYRVVGLYASVLELRGLLAGAKPLIPAPILYSLPDGLWVYSFTALMGFIWFNDSRRKAKSFWTLLPVSLAIGSEIGQFLKLIPGTFDWVDIFFYVAAWVLASASVNLFLRRRAVPSQLGAFQHEI